MFYNDKDGLILRREEETWQEGETPVGIVVFPYNHSDWGYGSTWYIPQLPNDCYIVMSLVPMSASTPESGGYSDSKQEVDLIDYGCYNYDITGKSDGLGITNFSVTNGLTNYTSVIYGDHSVSMPGNWTGSSTHLELQTEVGVNPEYHSSYMSPYINGVYINDPFTMYSHNESTDGDNAFHDMDGVVNTKIITDLVTRPSNWKTASSLTNDGNFSTKYYAPAACCCARYKTVGTKAFVDCSTSELSTEKGFWYLPSIGELGYIAAALADLNDTIRRISLKYDMGVQLSGSSYASSTEFGSTTFWRLRITDGYVATGDKNDNWNVRAFMRL